MNESRQTCESPKRLVASCALLGVIAFLTAGLVAGALNRGFGNDTLAVIAIGGGVCWIAAGLALAATYVSSRHGSPVQGVLAGMFFRMALPLAAVVVLPRLNERLAASGLVGTILGVYLVTLAVETFLALRLVAPQASAVKTG
jgi:hypothetical protein